MKPTDGLKTSSRTIDIDSIHSNITPEILEITIDKLKIVLLENEGRISSSNDWQAPLGILLTIILVICTADFRQTLGIKPEVWSAIFWLGTGLSAIWLGRAVINRKKRMHIDELIECMKRK